MSAQLILTHKRLNSPALLLLLGYLILALAGSLLLWLPAAQRIPVAWPDTLFTAVSAVTVTGLAVVDTATAYSPLGQTIIGLLIQLGGLGYMSLGAAAMLSFNASVGLRNQAMLISYWQLGPDLRLSQVIRFTLLFSLGLEAVLTALFSLHWVPLLGWERGLGTSLFHAVSAFNNAGFALFGDSLMSVSPGWMVLAHAAGFILGGLGFAVLYELLVLRRCRSIHSRLVLWATLALLVAGTLLLLLFEHEHSLAGLDWRERLLHAFFQNATARTAGFNSVDIAAMSPAGQAWLMLNMVVGAAPGSTAGGLRITTFVLLITGVVAALQGRTETRMLGRMLGVEHDKDTEIVIHVNKLKEGWDVTNLYTIVPLRASASEILTEQTIGRGLRLPYGKRTGVEAVDRLTIIAHDRFQEIIDKANDKESIIKKTLYIGSEDDENGIPEQKPKQMVVPSTLEALLGRQPTDGEGREVQDRSPGYQGSQSTQPPLFETESEKKVAELTFKIVSEEAKRLSSSKELGSAEVKASLAKKVQQAMHELMPPPASTPAPSGAETTMPAPEQKQQPLTRLDDSVINDLVAIITDKLVEHTIDIPQIVILPTREVNYGFTNFDLGGLERIALKPGSKEMQLHHLEDNRVTSISWEDGGSEEERLEDYLVRYLLDHNEIDYEEHAGSLYKLAGQMVAHLQGYLSDEEAESLLKTQGRVLADFIWAQMRNHMWTTPTDYKGVITKGFDVLHPATFNYAYNEQPRDFHAPIQPGEKSRIRQMLFTGFGKCCYPYQKFDSVDGEWRLAQILENDGDVLKWMKPAPGQFKIEYANGQNYEPDFVVETKDAFLLMEPKKATEVDSPEVQAKARAAVRWCFYANEHAKQHGGKTWHYVLIPHSDIELGRSVSGLRQEFEVDFPL